jgi:hypothetical protein
MRRAGRFFCGRKGSAAEFPMRMSGRADPAPTLVIFVVILFLIFIITICGVLSFSLLCRYKFIFYLK